MGTGVSLGSIVRSYLARYRYDGLRNSRWNCVCKRADLFPFWLVSGRCPSEDCMPDRGARSGNDALRRTRKKGIRSHV